MAKPVQLDFPPRNQEAEHRQMLATLPVEHAEVLADLLALAEDLRRHNVINTLRGAVGAGGELITYVSEATAQPEAARGLRNLIAPSKLLGSIHPELLESVQRSLPESWRDPAARDATTGAPSLWKVARTLTSPPARRVLMGVGVVLAGVGLHMAREKATRNG
ncbi:MAG TPA: hypothetical protein VME18_00565 [Acidobacteriaceae bacterium]|nr:hypothetical protein [Acidobacteriaceae bacterium]